MIPVCLNRASTVAVREVTPIDRSEKGPRRCSTFPAFAVANRLQYGILPQALTSNKLSSSGHTHLHPTFSIQIQPCRRPVAGQLHLIHAALPHLCPRQRHTERMPVLVRLKTERCGNSTRGSPIALREGVQAVSATGTTQRKTEPSGTVVGPHDRNSFVPSFFRRAMI